MRFRLLLLDVQACDDERCEEEESRQEVKPIFSRLFSRSFPFDSLIDFIPSSCSGPHLVMIVAGEYLPLTPIISGSLDCLFGSPQEIQDFVKAHVTGRLWIVECPALHLPCNLV